MDKAAKLQMQIRENSSELTDFLQDLTKWEENVKKEDEYLRTSRRIDEKLPPVRKGKKSTDTESTGKSTDTEGDQNNNKNKKSPQAKKEKIKSYDYDAWSKFDVEAACADVDGENESESDFEEEEEDEEEMERIEEQRKLQQAAMEKDKGNQFFKEGKYEAAINRYTTAINMDPNNQIFYANRGMALLKMERFGAAEQDCTFALQLDPKYTKALLRRATARLRLKKWKMALEDFNNVLEEEPNNKQAVTEIKNIQKMMKTDQDSQKRTHKEEQTKTKTERQEKRKKRSTKPLKRIYIQEVGGSEDENDQPQKTNEKAPVHSKHEETQEKRVPALHESSTLSKPPTSPPKTTRDDEDVKAVDLVIPTTSFMFETELKRLKDQPDVFYQYLKMIPCAQYTKLFRQCVDSLISIFLNTLHGYYIRDKLCVHLELENFCKVERFAMATMFLSKNDKKVIVELLNYMESAEYPVKLTEQQIASLRKSYK